MSPGAENGSVDSPAAEHDLTQSPASAHGPTATDGAGHGSKTVLIAARGVALGYDGHPALTGIDLDLPAGELVIVLGPNGGGKTTLFRGIMRELQPIDGVLDVSAPVAYLPQDDLSRRDFPVTARDVVLMGTLPERSVWQRAGREGRERATRALALVGLKEAGESGYGSLSGGQRRRVLLARTIVQRAPIVLLDEPLSGIDPASAEIIHSALSGLRDDGRLVIVASHDIEHARQADRVICVNRRLVAAGTPDAVLTETLLRQTYEAELTVVPGRDGAPPAFAAVEHHH